ncbi:MAG: MFS transporter [bacterium]|nr:MFS transporter [bacterium]
MSDTVVSEEKKDLTIRENIKLLMQGSRGFWLINFANFCDGVAYFGILNLLVLFLGANIGMSDAWSGRAVSFFTGAVTLFMLGGGFIPDKLGVRKALMIAVLVLLGGRILLVLAPVAGGGGWGAESIAWTSLLLMAVGSGIIQPTLYAGAKEYTDPRTAAVSFSLVYAIMNLGIVSEGFFSPFIRTNTPFISAGSLHINGLGKGIPGVFWFCVVVTAIVLMVLFLLFTKKVEKRDRIVAEQTEAEKVAAKTNDSFWQRIWHLPLFDPRFAFFIFMLLPVQTLFAHQWLTIPDYIMRAYPPAVGAKYEWIISINPFIIVIFVPLISALTRKANVLTMMIIGTTISAAITFILVPGPNLTRLLIYTIVFSFGEAAWSSRFYEYVAQIAPPGKVGSYMGMAGIPWFLAKFTTGLYSGVMIEKFIPQGGPHDTGTLWLIYAIAACSTPIGFVLAKKWLDKGMQKV